jgi:hypothetical protein
MKEIDQILRHLVTNNIDTLKESMAHRDVRILSSLYKNISGPNFITENQGRLIVKIFNENKKIVSQLVEDIDSSLGDPKWSKPFRPADKTKRIYVEFEKESSPVIAIEFAFSTAIRQKIMAMNKVLSGLVQVTSGKLYYASYTEKNIVALIDGVKGLGFDVDEKLMEFYEIIKSWSKTEIESKFAFDNITHEQFLKKIKAELNEDSVTNPMLVADRSVRYQYFTKKSEKEPENTTEIIANRYSTKVWIDKSKFSLDNIFESLVELNRLPTLLVFDSYGTKESAKELAKISEILEKNGITDNVGIYFRLANDEQGKEFNQLISQKKYNCVLTPDTKIVGVQSGKIPKFLLKNDWKPMSVISIGNSLRHNKTAVYANCCDLVITYTDKEPLYEPKIAWE